MNSKNILNDLKSGLVVFLVALPLCLGIALAQNAPLFSGIIAGIIGGIVISLISDSKLSVSGPAAGLTSIVLTSVTQLGSFEAFLLSVVIAGIIQVIFGVVRAGTIGYYFPTAVIKGMLSAIGIILIMKQIPHFMGYDKDYEGDESFIQPDGQNSLTEISNMLNYISPGSIIIGAISLFILLLWRTSFFKNNTILKVIPSALVVVIMGILIDQVFHYFLPAFEVKDEHLVMLPKFSSMSDVLAGLTHPDFNALNNSKIFEIAAIIAVVASLETLLSIEAIDKLDPENHITSTNRELIAQGIGNICSGMLGGLPITSVIVRSSANKDAGAKSKMSAFFHGCFFIIALFLLPGLLTLIPLSALAAILILTGYNLAKPSLYINTYKQGWDQFIPFIITVSVMLFTDLLKGVSFGIVAAIVFILNQSYRSPFKMIKEEINGKMNYFIKFTQNITFINKGKFIDLFKTIEPNSIVYLDGGRANFIDKDVLEIISAFKQSAHIHNIEVNLEEIQEVEVLSHH